MADSGRDLDAPAVAVNRQLAWEVDHFIDFYIATRRLANTPPNRALIQARVLTHQPSRTLCRRTLSDHLDALWRLAPR